ncbi:MAG: hypothetical protein R2705_00810 [Ilumatobacteraceae bacterium]
MPAPISLDTIRSLPKVLLHDHLDGGLRPATVIELADTIGWSLPSTDVEELSAWFTAGASTKDLSKYLATFEHTLAVMQHEDAIRRGARGGGGSRRRWCRVRRDPLAPSCTRIRGFLLQEIVEAVADGVRSAERDAAAAGTPITVNPDPVRHAHRRPVTRDRHVHRTGAVHRTQGGGLRSRRGGDGVPAVDARRGPRPRAPTCSI